MDPLLLILLVLAPVLTVLGWVFRIVGRSSSSRMPKETGPEHRVGFSVYHPDEVSTGSTFTVLAYAHRVELEQGDTGEPASVPEEVDDHASAHFLSGKAPPPFIQRVTGGQSAPLAPATELRFRLRVVGCTVQPPEQGVAWAPPFQRVAFEVTVPAGLIGSELEGTLTVARGLLVQGRVDFSVRLGGEAGAPRMASGRSFDRVFASYSHKDREVVAQVEEVARALRHRYLRDVVNLRAGDRWESGVRELIQEADLFQLFWSNNAMQSEQVRKEWEYAVSLRRTNFIAPVYWEDPLPEDPDRGLPPPPLKALHFARIGPFGPPRPSVQDPSSPVSH
jgi:hypothetical protein